MHFLNRIRNYSFWTLDLLNRRQIKNHIDEIKILLNNPLTDSSIQTSHKHLKNILTHAQKTTLYYRYLSKSNQLSQFPVIDKSTIIKNFASFKSDNYINKRTYKVSTSGSTGVPFELYQNKNKRLRNKADVIYFSQSTGYSIGDKLWFLESWRLLKKENKIISFLKNIEYLDVSKFNTTQIIDFLNKINSSNNPQTLIGLPSAFETIRKNIEFINLEKDRNFNIKTVITISEYLDKNLKLWIKQFFNTEVVSRYSNEEMGILAQHEKEVDDDLFNFNWASYYLEILKMDNNEPAEYGELGRLVITDLFNYCMPLIRYDTGDVGAFDYEDKIKTYKLKKIYGRKMDLIYDTNGNIVSPHLIHTIFYPFFNYIKQYQFIQTGCKDYLIKINLYDGFNNKNELVTIVKKEFGTDSNIIIKFVDEIPLLSSGKRKKVMNTFR